MASLKETDAGFSSTSEPVKKKRGNPNLKKGQKNPYYEKTTMSEETQTVTPDSEEQTTSSGSGEKKTIPKDIWSDEVPQEPILPLDDAVKTKDYASIKDGEQKSSQNGQSKSSETTSETSTSTSETSSTDAGSGVPPVAPLDGGKSSEEIRTEAEQMVKMILRGYEKLHGVGRWIGKVDDNELMNLHMQKKIDLDFSLPLGTKNIKLREFFASYNQEIDENIVVTDDFKAEITPPLVRMAIKRGWSLGDEIFAMMLAAEDLGTKVSLLIGLKKSANLILDACQTIMKKQNEPKEEKKVPKEPIENNSDQWQDAPSQDVNYEEIK